MVSAALRASIEALYVTFAGHQAGAGLVACQHCTSAVDTSRLASTAVPALPPDTLATVALKVGGTWGGADELRAVLPRLCELAALGTPEVPLRWVTAALARAGWLGWPAPEQHAVAEFLDALWHDVLVTERGYHEVGGTLHALGLAIDDLHPFLATWHQLVGDGDNADRLVAVDHLGRYVVNYRREFAEARLPAPVMAWLRGPTTRIQLDRAIYDFSGTPVSERARLAIEIIETTSAR